MAPLGSSDHNIVKWTTNMSKEAINNKSIKKNICCFPLSACQAFGRWCSSHEWFTDIAKTNSASKLASAFTKELNSAINRIFPTKVVKIHHSDKPWMTPALKKLIDQRQKAFHSGNKEIWRHYKLKVRKDILLKKRMHYENKVKHLKSNYPRKWWDYVNQMTGKKKSTPSSINFVKDGAILSGKDPITKYIFFKHQ
jgi:hypothetical protein